RPIAQSIEAWVVLPKELSDGVSYEEPQKSGDIISRVAKSKARIRVTTQTPIEKCWIEEEYWDTGEGTWIAARVTKKHDKKASLPVSEDGMWAEGQVQREVGNPRKEKALRFHRYEARMVCPHGFENTEVPQGAITYVPLSPPQVRFLLEARYEIGDTGPRE